MEKKNIEHILGMESLNTETYNNNDFYSYLQKNDLIYIYILNESYHINETPDGASNMQRIAQLLHSIKTIFNIKSNFHRY